MCLLSQPSEFATAFGNAVVIAADICKSDGKKLPRQFLKRCIGSDDKESLYQYVYLQACTFPTPKLITDLKVIPVDGYPTIMIRLKVYFRSHRDDKSINEMINISQHSRPVYVELVCEMGVRWIINLN